MTIAKLAAGLVLSTGITTFSINVFQDLYGDLKEIKLEPLEEVNKGISSGKAIDIVRRNDEKRKRLILKLNKVLSDAHLNKD